MKTLSLLGAVVLAALLAGCENPELVACQEEKQVLQTRNDGIQQQLDEANAVITQKDEQIKKLKIENTEMQTKAMESIQTMLQKQAAADEKLKKQLAEKDEQIKQLKNKVAELESQVDKQKQQLDKTAETVEEAAEVVEEQM
jgi:chromosome segregation ATPase